MAAATATLTASFFVPLGAAQSGWTAYATLSTAIGAPGAGQTMWTVAIYFNGVSTVMGAINYITTVVRLRAPGMTWFRLPLTVWGFLLTSILNALFVPVLAAAMVLLFFDRVFGTQFFIAGSTIRAGGDPILYQHLFWLFGHPEVYILILPAWGIVSDLLSFFARKPAFGYRVTVWALIGVVVLSCVVYGHHMFTTGMSPLLGESFMVLTMIISVPTSLLFLNWLGTLWRGAARMHDADAVLRGAGVHVRHRRADRALPGGHRRGPVPARHLLRRRALPPDHGGGAAAGVVRGRLFLVPEDVRPDDERAPRQAALLADVPGVERRVRRPAADRLGGHAAPPLRSVGVRVPRAPAALERLDLARRVRAGRGAAGVRPELLREPALGQAGARQPVGGRHAGVDAAVAAAASQLRRHPDRRARAARARPSRCAARAARTGWPRTRSCREPRGVGAASERRRRHGGLPGRVRDAVRGAAVRVRGRAVAGVGVAAARDAAVSARRRRQQRPAAARRRLRAAARAHARARSGPPSRSGWARCSC